MTLNQGRDVLGSCHYLGQDQLGQVVFVLLLSGAGDGIQQMLGVKAASELHSSCLLFVVCFLR